MTSKMINGEVNVYDILGQLITSRKLSGNNTATISLDPKSAVYIVKYTSNNITTTKRIFIY